MTMDLKKKMAELAASIGTCSTKISKEEAMEVFDGLMLGDAGLHREGSTAYFYVGQSAGDPNQWQDTSWNERSSKISQMQYLWYIRDCLESLGIEFSEFSPKAEVRLGSNGRPVLFCLLRSLSSVFLCVQYKRWYHFITDEVRKARLFTARQKWYKILPDDIVLTPLTVAKWFEGDGSTPKSLGSQALLVYTNNFAKEEVERLSNLLLPFNIVARVTKQPSKKAMHWMLSVGAIDSVNAFFDLTGGLIHSCFNYKIKRARHASECSTEEEKENLRKRNKYCRASKNKYNSKNREHVNELWRNWCSNNREHYNERMREWYRKKREGQAVEEATSTPINIL